MAAAVTVTDAVIAFPFAYYMARVATPRLRTLLFVLVLLPLWSSYLARIYAWRLILNQDGALNWSLAKLGLPEQNWAFTSTAMWIVFSYIWLPFMILPIYAALERIPDSVPRSVARSRRTQLDDVPARDPPARAAGHRGGLDLHVLADARRLHHAVARRQRRLHRQRHLPQRPRPDEQPAVRGGLRDRPADRDGASTSSLAKRLGAFEAL